MGWDLIVLSTKPADVAASELTNESTRPLGTRAEILETIEEVFPGVDVTEPEWIVITDAAYSIEITLIETAHVELLMLHVHGSSEALSAVSRLCSVGGWRAFDTALGEFIEFDTSDSDAGLRLAYKYRDQVLGANSDPL